jgi:RND family efflux transporter MFP subunit
MNTRIFRITVLGLLGVGLLGWVAWRMVDATATRTEVKRQTEATVAPVSIAAVTRRNMVERAILTGVIRPQNEVDIFTKVPGRVEEVRAKVGDRVKEGEVLAVIEHREISLQSEQAQAQLQAALAALEGAKVGFEAATAAYKRYEALRNNIAQADFERVESAYRQARAGVMAAESQVATARAAAALAAELVRNSRITTPIAGTVTSRLIDVGKATAPGVPMPLFQIQDVAVLKLETTASAADFARLAAGQEALITVSDRPGAIFPGRVSTLSPSLDPRSRRAAVEIVISNPDGRLMPNMFAQAAIEIDRKTAALAVPESAVVSTPSGRAVFVVRNERAVQLQPKLGSDDNGFVMVESGLGEGDRVVVAGQTTLHNGIAVRVVADKQEKVAAP